MRWQKTARLVIAVFVVVFAGVVFLSMRRATTPNAAPPPVKREDGAPKVQNTQGALLEKTENGKLVYRLWAQRHLGFRDGNTQLAGVELTLPDRRGKTIVITSDKAAVAGAPGKDIKTGTLTGHVRLATSDGVEIRSETATYTEASGIVNVPGPVEFTRGRMSGRGVGATYDQHRDVLWLLAQAHITTRPDDKGQGAAEATASSAGLARADNYTKLVGNARVVSDGRTVTADELTAILKPDGETLERVDLRGSSRITETGANARTMSAKDIDLAYAPDGRTLQRAKLMENAAVDLPATASEPARRITGRTIEMTMAPDGTTLTSLLANEHVVVDLPARGDAPGKQVRAAKLEAAGPGGQGLQSAVFTGGVEYRETRAARGPLAAIDRTARSVRLTLATKPGFGDIEQADFRGNFKFIDASKVSAESPRAVYYIARDRMELSPSDGDPGPTPAVTDERFRVEARNIQLSPDTRKLTADTNVRSTIQPQRRTAPATSGKEDGRGGIAPVAQPGEQARMPVILKQDRPVYVAANKLSYDGKAEATYTGNARLWQDKTQSKIDADTIVINDRTGNLTARTNVSTSMLLEEVDPETKQKKVSLTTATSDVLVYDDAKRLAVYTGTPATRATMKGVYGDLMADRIDVYLKEGGSELERAEAHRRVTVQEGLRLATGDVLVYTASNDTYVMNGNPVEAIEQDTAKSCKKTTGTTLTFQRSVGSIRAETAGFVPVKGVPVPCPAELRR